METIVCVEEEKNILLPSESVRAGGGDHQVSTE